MAVINVHIEVENPTVETQVLVFEQGRCFEVPDPHSGLQNVVLCETVEIVLEPQEQNVVVLPAYCLNRKRELYGRHEAVITPFVLDQPVKTQNQVWNLMERVAA
ncbi:MAG: hypothetical protein ABIH23_01080 [bacterium]